MKTAIKKGDKVIVASGREKGKTGRILRVLPERQRVIVEGLNLVKKHMRRRSEQEAGGIKEVPMSLHVSSVALFCGHCNQGVRFGIKTSGDKTKVRICRRCQRTL